MDKLTTQELAEKTNLSPGRIRQLVQELEAAGHAHRFSGVWAFDPTAVEYILNRADSRGRPPKETK